MNHKHLGEIYYDVTTKRVQANLTFACIIFMLIILFLPNLLTPFLVTKEDRMSKDIGYIEAFYYDKYVNLAQENQVNFDLKTYFGYSFMDIDDERYGILFSEEGIFETGMISPILPHNSFTIYELEFLHGGAFKDSDEIVIDENMSLEIFETSNSINQHLEIKGRVYTIVGVIKSNDAFNDYIYMPIDNTEFLLDDDYFSYDGYIFKDEDLHLKLYQIGGYNLVSNSVTYLQQENVDSIASLTYHILILVFYFILLIIGSDADYTNNRKTKTKKTKFKDYQEQGPKKYLLKSFYGLTWKLGIWILSLIIFASHTMTIKVAIYFTFNLLIHYPVPLLFYMFIVIDVIIKSSKNRKLQLKT